MADTAVRTYDPKKIAITFRGNIITGIADGDFVEITGDDGFEMRKGAAGDEDRINKNETGKDVNVTLMQTSISNDILSAIYESDAINNDGKGPLQIVDLNGTSILYSAQAYIKKSPDTTKGDSLGTTVWNFRAPQATYVPGGNL